MFSFWFNLCWEEDVFWCVWHLCFSFESLVMMCVFPSLPFIYIYIYMYIYIYLILCMPVVVEVIIYTHVKLIYIYIFIFIFIYYICLLVVFCRVVKELTVASDMGRAHGYDGVGEMLHQLRFVKSWQNSENLHINWFDIFYMNSIQKTQFMLTKCLLTLQCSHQPRHGPGVLWLLWGIIFHPCLFCWRH